MASLSFLFLCKKKKKGSKVQFSYDSHFHIIVSSILLFVADTLTVDIHMKLDAFSMKILNSFEFFFYSNNSGGGPLFNGCIYYCIYRPRKNLHARDAEMSKKNFYSIFSRVVSTPRHKYSVNVEA